MSPERSIAVLVVDDDAIVRDWVRHALDATEFRVAGEASSAAEALDLLRRRHVDVLLLDHWLPEDALGTELVRAFRREGMTLPVVLMTAHVERGLNEAAREAGIQASIVKSHDPAALLTSLRSVVAGRKFFDPQHPRRREGEAPLAPRERDVMRLIARGLTTRQVAGELGIGDETVKTPLKRAYAKLGAHRRADAVLAARRRGFV